MELKIKAVGAYFTPDGIVADTVSNPKYAKYKTEIDDNTYNLYVTSEHAPAGVSVRIPVEVGEDDTIFMNGFQSATESRELDASGKMSGIDVVSSYTKHLFAEAVGGDCAIVKYKNKPRVTHGFSYCYFKSGEKIRLFASLDESTGYTVFKYDAQSATLKISKDIEGVNSFDGYKAISLFYAEGEENEVFDLWFEKLGKSENHPAPELVGYSTKKLEYISEIMIDRKLNAVNGCFPVKPNIYLVEGEYSKNGDWLMPYEDKFPSGMRVVSDMIKESDIMSGLCISPFTVDEDSEIYKQHKDWLLVSKNGERYIKTKEELFVLDSENEEVRAYIRDVIHTILFMWGFDLIKIDNLYVAGIIPSNGKSRGEKMCSAMSFLRECCGGKLMYADNTPLMPAFNVADYCSVSCGVVSDTLPTAYSKRFYRESASVRNASADIVFRRALNKRAFLSAPCSITLDDKEYSFDGKLNNAEQNVITNLSGLFTSVLIINDSGAAFDQKKKRRFKKMCDLKNASSVKVTRTNDGFLVSYKYEDKAYVVKFK